MNAKIIAGIVAASALAAGSAPAATTPMTPPPGITLVDVSKLMDAGAPQFLWRRLGDAEGRPLYTADADPIGQSVCANECAKEFPPYLAAKGAKAQGDWTIIVRADGQRQWAYQGKPLYRYSGVDPRGEPQGARFQLKEDPAWRDPASATFVPKPGWRRAAYAPEKSTVMPANLKVAALSAAGGVGIVSTATRMTVYRSEEHTSELQSH